MQLCLLLNVAQATNKIYRKNKAICTLFLTTRCIRKTKYIYDIYTKGKEKKKIAKRSNTTIILCK